MIKKPKRSWRVWCWLFHRWHRGADRQFCVQCDRGEVLTLRGWKEYRPSEHDLMT